MHSITRSPILARITRLPMLALLLSVSACDLSGCAAVSKAGPTLQAVVSRVDVPRLLECASAGEPKDVARCLGARALTEGLRIALERATSLAEDAQLASTKGTGAADMTDADRAALAAELDEALDTLAVEIAATNE